jgi:hypothetical protein
MAAALMLRSQLSCKSIILTFSRVTLQRHSECSRCGSLSASIITSYIRRAATAARQVSCDMQPRAVKFKADRYVQQKAQMQRRHTSGRATTPTRKWPTFKHRVCITATSQLQSCCLTWVVDAGKTWMHCGQMQPNKMYLGSPADHLPAGSSRC